MWDKLGQLKARKLGQWALAYAGVAWLLLQLFDILGDQFAWPATFRRSLTVVLGMGFLAALVPARRALPIARACGPPNVAH